MITIHSPLNQLPGLCSRLCVTSSGTPWLSQSLLSFAYLKFKYKVKMDPVLIMTHLSLHSDSGLPRLSSWSVSPYWSR